MEQPFLVTEHINFLVCVGQESVLMRTRDPISKAIDLIDVMLSVPNSTWGVRELARKADLPPTTVHRLLTALKGVGFVDSDPDSGSYAVGLGFYRMAWQTDTHFPIRTVAAKYMRELVDCCNESALLVLYSPRRMEMIFASMLDSPHPVRYVIPLHEWVPVYTSASGMAIMAFLPPSERKQIIERTRLRALTERSITDPEELEKALAQIRSQGYAYTRGQRTPGSVGIAVPIFRGQEPRVIGDLMVTIPEQRFDEALVPHLANLVAERANKITEELGGRLPTQEELNKL
jgi:IclR family acetate operon transcriptional repressor